MMMRTSLLHATLAALLGLTMGGAAAPTQGLPALEYRLVDDPVREIYALFDRLAAHGLPDGAERLGAMLEAAGSGDDPESSAVFAATVHAYADAMRVSVRIDRRRRRVALHDDHFRGVRDNVGRLLARHIADVNRPLVDGLPPGGPLEAVHLDRADLGYALLGVARDPAGYSAVVTTQLAYLRLEMERALARPGSAFGRVHAMEDVATAGGVALGFIEDARVIGSGWSRPRDGLLDSYAAAGVGFIVPTPGTGVTALAAMVARRPVPSTAEREQFDQPAAEIVHAMLESALVAHHLVGYGAGRPVDLSTLRAEFVGADPPGLIPLERMTPRQYDVFIGWQYDTDSLPWPVDSRIRGKAELAGVFGLPV